MSPSSSHSCSKAGHGAPPSDSPAPCGLQIEGVNFLSATPAQWSVEEVCRFISSLQGQCSLIRWDNSSFVKSRPFLDWFLPPAFVQAVKSWLPSSCHRKSMGRLCCSCERTISSPPWISSWVPPSRSAPPSTPCVSDAGSAWERWGEGGIIWKDKDVRGRQGWFIQNAAPSSMCRHGDRRFVDVECWKACMYTVTYEWGWTAWGIHARSVGQVYVSLWVEAFCMYTLMKLCKSSPR